MALRSCWSCAHYKADHRDPGGIPLKCTKLLVNVAPDNKGCRFWKSTGRAAK